MLILDSIHLSIPHVKICGSVLQKTNNIFAPVPLLFHCDSSCYGLSLFLKESMTCKDAEVLQIDKFNISLAIIALTLMSVSLVAESWEPTFFGAVDNKVLGWAGRWLLLG